MNTQAPEEAWERSRSYLEPQPSVPASLRELLRRFRLHPRKSFGQNFLVDEQVLQRIVAAADLQAQDTVLEVGPGLGVLTKELASRAGRVVAVEVDRDVIDALRRVVAGYDNVEIIVGDILEFDFSVHFKGIKYKVVANLPYYIATPTLRRFLEAEAKPSLLVITVQREVAERIVALPGDMSLLSVSVQLYGEPKLVTLIDPSAFYPPPKVDSAVVRIDVYDKPAVDVDIEKFFRVVQAGFSRARKQLHNALAQSIWLPPGAAKEILQASGVDPSRRAQTLQLQEWAAVTREIERRGFL